MFLFNFFEQVWTERAGRGLRERRVALGGDKEQSINTTVLKSNLEAEIERD